MDIVKPLKLETLLDGSEYDMTPVETKPSDDYLASRGISFEGLSDYLSHRIGRVLLNQTPDDSQKITYSGVNITDVEFFLTASQVVANRVAKVTIAYSGINPSTETWVIYGPNGTTVLKTFTLTHTFSGVDLTNTAQVTT